MIGFGDKGLHSRFSTTSPIKAVDPTLSRNVAPCDPACLAISVGECIQRNYEIGSYGSELISASSRKSKIKCVNSGSSPCQKCSKSGIAGCVLSRPQPGTPKRDVHRVTKVQKRVSTQSQPRCSTAASSRLGPQPSSGNRPDVNKHLTDLSEGDILKALNVFTNKFPELAFVHVSAFMDEWRSSTGSKEIRALLAAILAVTKGQLSILKVSWDENLLSGDHYATSSKDILSDVLLEVPKIQVVQALLIITLYEWGCRNFHKAWVYCGKTRKRSQ